jgi:hypothetical protein
MQVMRKSGRSRCPGGLRQALSSLARMPESWVRIPLRAWMFSVSMCVKNNIEIKLTKARRGRQWELSADQLRLSVKML